MAGKGLSESSKRVHKYPNAISATPDPPDILPVIEPREPLDAVWKDRDRFQTTNRVRIERYKQLPKRARHFRDCSGAREARSEERHRYEKQKATRQDINEINSALRQIKKLEKRLDRVRIKLEDNGNEELYLQAQLQPMQEARAKYKEIGQAPVFMDEACFTVWPADDTYACAVARRKALAAQVIAKSGNDITITEALQGIAMRKSLPNEAEDQGCFHFMRGIFGTRAFTVRDLCSASRGSRIIEYVKSRNILHTDEDVVEGLIVREG
ncbi:MAG: hypothetical protein ASARMPRED_006156 [Alectoria sarmentosa]|nr:MAG: hypothetical protein ASARMPRED_006156 [Alectoria sarmentosa]